MKNFTFLLSLAASAALKRFESTQRASINLPCVLQPEGFSTCRRSLCSSRLETGSDQCVLIKDFHQTGLQIVLVEIRPSWRVSWRQPGTHTSGFTDLMWSDVTWCDLWDLCDLCSGKHPHRSDASGKSRTSFSYSCCCTEHGTFTSITAKMDGLLAVAREALLVCLLCL